MSTTTQTHEIYMQGLRNAHAEERQAIETLQRQVERLEHYPELKAGLERHVQESQRQQERLEQILGTHGTNSSSFKEAVTGVVGNISALGHTAASDEVLKNTFRGCALEHHEIAAYTSLIAMAEAVGDHQHISLLRQNLQEEEAMAKFMEGQVVPVTKRYLELAAAGETAKV